MKAKYRIWLCPLIMVLVLVLTYSCKKDEKTPETITDKDGNVYTSVTIGTQVWMVENLKTTKLNDGTEITPGIDNTYWQSNYKLPSYCWCNDDITNKTPYGALYNLYAVNTGKLCPTGWHVPTDAEWHQLVLFLDPNATQGEDESLIAGAKLKESGTAHWTSPNTGATNESGFTALPGGYRAPNGFALKGSNGYYWTFGDMTIMRLLYNGTNLVTRTWEYSEMGHSVRCLKD
jgi:uncharacterized protein (TIGR02145 family)